MSSNQDIFDRLIQAQIELHRYSNTLNRTIARILSESDLRIRAKLLDVDLATLSAWQLEQLLREIHEVISGAYFVASTTVKNEMSQLAVIQAGILSGVMGVDTLPPSSLSAISIIPITVSNDGKMLFDEIFVNLAQSKSTRIRQAIRLGISEGQSAKDIADSVIGTRSNKYNDGIVSKDRRGVEAVTQTIINHVSNQAYQAVYKANPETVEMLQWRSVLDLRTTPICQYRDGKVFPVDSGPRPPAHIRCRSVMVPLMRSGTRNSMDGKVPASVTYESWLKSQSYDRQVQVLGKSRADLFQSGKYGLSDFLNDKGTYKKLTELQESN